MEHTNTLSGRVVVWSLRSHDRGHTRERGHGGPDPRRISQKALLLRRLGRKSGHTGRWR